MPTRTILLVDDDDAVRDSFKALLELESFTVKTFASCEDVLRSLPSAATCLILDVHLPGMGGFELIEALKRRSIRMPTMLMSGRCDSAIRKRARELGVVTVLEKPFELQDLTAAIARCG